MLQRLTVSKLLSLLVLITIFFQSNLLEGFSNIAKAQFSTSYQQQLQDEIHNQLKQNNLPSHQGQYLSNLRLNQPSNLPNSNIYLRTLNSFTEEIQPSIYEGMSLVTNYSTQELESIFEYNNLQPFLATESDLYQIQSLQNKYQELLNLYQQEKDFFTNLAQLKQKTAIYEIFVDGNTQNSGFDLIADLNQIEQKLFLSNQPRSIQYNNRNNFWNQFNSEPILTNLQPVSAFVYSEFTSSLDQDQSSNSNTTSQDNTDTPNQPNRDPINLDPTPEYQFPTLQYGAVCEIDPKLKQELDIYADQQATNSANQSDQNTTTDANPSPTQAEGSNSSSNNSSNPVVPATQSSPFNPSNFQLNQSCPADQIFCFTQEIKYNQVDLIYPQGSTDCIGCTINRLNQSLQTLLDNGVLPQKITGNFGEPAICKQGSVGKIALNLNLIPKPLLPELPNTSLIENTNSQKLESTQQLQNSISLNPDFSISEETRVDTDQNILQQSSSYQYIQTFDQQLQSEFSQNAKVIRAVTDQQILFDKLSNQASTLNIYFQAFQESLEQMNVNFIELANLPECSTL